MREIIDVLQVGYGPVGQSLAALLGKSGHTLRVIERHDSLYQMSRAGTFDSEIMRVLQSIGVADELEPLVARNMAMVLQDKDGELLAGFNTPKQSAPGWHAAYTMYQPDLERVLDAAVRRASNVEVITGWEVTGLQQHDDYVRVERRNRKTNETVHDLARYVVGVDGANSAVRRLADLNLDDLGYRGPWLVCDFEHHDPNVDLPFTAGFALDPARPRLFGRWLGRHHSRLEFMVLPHENPADLDTEDACWALAAEYGMTPATSSLVRHAVYEFGSLLAPQWRSGRVLLAGDAAHVMPPFLGQGLCSGVRDAANLSWKLDLVLRGEAKEDLLSVYTTERAPHVETIIRTAMGLGEMVSITDPEQAAGRDEFMRSVPAPPPMSLPTLTTGVLHRDEGGTPRNGVGDLGLQAQIELDGRRGRLDDLVGSGWHILTRRAIGTELLASHQALVMKRLDATVVTICAAPCEGRALDVDLDYEEWFDSLDADAVIVRPDFYVYAVLRGVNELGAAVDDLARQLSLT